MLNSKRPDYHVGQQLYSRTKRKSLFLENSIEGAPIKKAVILSESALQNDQYKALENKSKIETLL